MAALTDNLAPMPQFESVRDSAQETRAIKVYDTADEYYNGALLGEYQGRIAPLGVANYRFVGVCEQRVSAGASSGKTVPINTAGRAAKGIGVTGASAAADKGRSVFCATDNIEDATLTIPTDGTHEATHIGWVYEYHGGAAATDILLRQPEEDTGLVVIDFGSLTMSGIGSFAETVVPGFAGRLLGIGVTVTTVTSDADAEGILTPTVNGASVTGTLTTTDTAGATNKFDTVGDTYIAAISGANAVFAANQEILISGTQTTAYTDGVGRVFAIVERY